MSREPVEGALPDDLTIEALADPGMLRVVRGMVRCYVAEAGYDQERTEEIVLGVDEACTNAIRHAYCGDGARRYRVALRKDAVWMEIQVQDDGECAPTEAFSGAEGSEATAGEVQPGGLGIPLIQRIFDEVSYCPKTERGNCVVLRMRRPGSQA